MSSHWEAPDARGSGRRGAREPRHGARTARHGAGFVGLLALLAAACGKTESVPPSAILVTIDTLRMDALSPYGAPTYVSPRLERLAAECVRYTEARTVAPLTLPAHASLLTGLYPPRHGLRDNGLCALPASAECVAERAREAGAQTAAFVSALVLDHAFALDQGFDVYDQPARPERQVSSHFPERPARETVARAREWLAARDRSRPFFLWIHLYDPHVPYAPPPEFLAQAHGDAYRGEIASADAALGALFDELRADGTLASTFLAITSDHGESLGEHGEPTHGAFCYDATLRVPLLVRHPDARGAGTVCDDPVSLVDLAPTLVRALGARPLADVDGVDLYERAPGRGRGLYCESYSGFLNYGWSPLAGWIENDEKVLFSSRSESYDLAHDAHETRDRFPEPKERVTAAEIAVAQLCDRPVLRAGETGGAISEALRRDLRQLGYGASGTLLAELPHPLAKSDRPAPRDGAGELEPLLIANALLDARNFEEATPILARIVDANPRHLLALDLYGFSLLQLGRFAEARAIFERRFPLGVPRADTCLNWALACERSAAPDEALRLYERALELDPLSVPALEALARLAEARGDAARAEEYAKRLAAARK